MGCLHIFNLYYSDWKLPRWRTKDNEDHGSFSPEFGQLRSHPCDQLYHERLSDLIGPYWGTYRIVYRVIQPLLVGNCAMLAIISSGLQIFIPATCPRGELARPRRRARQAPRRRMPRPTPPHRLGRRPPRRKVGNPSRPIWGVDENRETTQATYSLWPGCLLVKIYTRLAGWLSKLPRPRRFGRFFL